jgi:hypothetical protein
MKEADLFLETTTRSIRQIALQGDFVLDKIIYFLKQQVKLEEEHAASLKRLADSTASSLLQSGAAAPVGGLVGSSAGSSSVSSLQSSSSSSLQSNSNSNLAQHHSQQSAPHVSASSPSSSAHNLSSNATTNGGPIIETAWHPFLDTSRRLVESRLERAAYLLKAVVNPLEAFRQRRKIELDKVTAEIAQIELAAASFAVKTRDDLQRVSSLYMKLL